MLRQHTSTGGSKIDLAALPDAVLHFDPTRVVTAIVFHMMDDEIAREVEPDTIKRTLDRLKSDAFEGSISRRRWGGMSNSHRLQWLLDQTETAFDVGDDIRVSLRARRRK